VYCIRCSSLRDFLDIVATWLGWRLRWRSPEEAEAPAPERNPTSPWCRSATRTKQALWVRWQVNWRVMNNENSTHLLMSTANNTTASNGTTRRAVFCTTTCMAYTRPCPSPPDAKHPVQPARGGHSTHEKGMQLPSRGENWREGTQLRRVRTHQVANASRPSATTMKMAASMLWNGQKRSAGW
jgi:hypothetical protein